MEDLQDAIADARYMGERANQKLEPLVPIKWPAAEDLESFRAAALSEDPVCFTFEAITAQPAGLYYFLKFTENIEPNANNMIHMMEEISDFKATTNLKLRLLKAVKLYEYYLAKGEGEIEIKGDDGEVRTGMRKTSVSLSVGGKYYPKRTFVANAGQRLRQDSDTMETVAASFHHTKKQTPSENQTNQSDASSPPPHLEASPEESERLESRRTEGQEPAKNRVGVKPEIAQTVRDLIQKEVDLEDRLKDDYGNPEAGFHFCGFNPSLFDEILINFMKSFRKIETKFLKDDLFRKFLSVKWMEKAKVGQANFASYRIVGRGGFGEVFAQKRIETGKMYAVKLLHKGVIKQKKAEDLCWNEMKALSICKSPFVVSLKYAFQTKAELYLVLDLMSGGDLCFHLNKSPNGRFPADQARFHAAEILLGLRHLHEHGYVYRDLKPDNVLLNDQGHCKISDLGLAIQKDKILVGTAGTLGYMPPEMFRRGENGEYDPYGKKVPYDHSVDWWSFGCVVFEMLVGKCPFRTSAAKQYYEKLFNKPCPGGNSLSYRYATCSMEVEYVSSVFQGPDGQNAVDLIRGCLQRDPRQRLGSSEYLFHRLKNHPWFSENIDLTMVGRQLLQPLFIPKRTEINAESIREIKKETAKRESAKITPQDQERWQHWYYMSNEAFQEEMVELAKYEEEYGTIEFQTEDFKFCSIS